MEVSNELTLTVLCRLLEAEGYGLKAIAKAGQPGPDIVAVRGDEEVAVEVIGLKGNLANRANAFYKAFFQTLTRIGDGARGVAIAVPVEAEPGLRTRARDRKSAWQRLGSAFPEVYVWFVDTKNAGYRRVKWNDLAQVP